MEDANSDKYKLLFYITLILAGILMLLNISQCSRQKNAVFIESGSPEVNVYLNGGAERLDYRWQGGRWQTKTKGGGWTDVYFPDSGAGNLTTVEKF
jgi:hypothetical protein